MQQQLQMCHNSWEVGTYLKILSFIAIDMRSRVARYPVQDKGGEAPLEEDGAPGHQVGDCLALLLPGVPGKSTTQLLDLSKTVAILHILL